MIEKNVLHRDEDRGSRGSRKGEPRRGNTPGGTPPRKPPLQGGRPFRTLAFWAFVALLSLVAFRMYQGSFMAPQRIEISYTRFIAEVEKGNIQDVQIIEKMVTGDLRAEASIKIGAHEVPFKAFKTNILGDGSDLPDRVWKTNPGIEVEVRNPSFNWVSVLIGWLPVAFVLVLWLFMVRQVQSGGSAALKFGKTKARVLLESSPKVTFKDVAGCDEAKQELQEIIEFLKEPQKFQRLGGRIPKGALLLGPPGSGKTLLAKAVAGEAGVPFFSMSGSDFVEMFVGVGASVTGDTPVLIRQEGATRITTIGEFVDGFYSGDDEGRVVPVEGVETLGFEERDSKFKGSPKTFVKGSAWSRVRGVYRHLVSEICEIHYLGGVIRTTADHSVFVRTRDGIKPVAARELKPGDVLVKAPGLPAEVSSVETTHADHSAALRARENGTATLVAPEIAAGAGLNVEPWHSPAAGDAIVLSVLPRPYDGFVYDLCGCDNEAFFGGEQPVLLHNSRVRDLFEQGKRNAPCLTGDAVVTLSGGKQITIQEMFDKKMVGVRVPAMVAGEFRFEDATVIGMTRKRCTDLYEVTTATSSIKATGNHLFPVLRGEGFEWVRVDELREGECVAAPRVIGTDSHPPYFHDFLADETLVHFRGDSPGRHARLGEVRCEMPRRHSEIERLSIGRGGFGSSYLDRAPLHVHEEMAYVCGLVASDGYYGAPGHRTVGFVNTETALHESLRESLENLFGYSPKRHLNKKHFEIVLPQGTHPQSLKDCYTTYINNRLLCDALRSFQARILEMPAYMVACWLRGVFDGDGHVRVNPSTPQIVISAWHRTANQLVRDALLRIGIVTSLSPKALVGKDGNICITGAEALRRFAWKVRSDHPAKAERLTQILALLGDRESSSSRLECIPAQGMIRAARESLGMGQRAFRRGHYVSQYERGLVTPSRTSLQSVVAEMEAWSEAQGVPLAQEAEDLRDLTESAVMWSRIDNIKRVEPVEFVYDLCLDRHNCFIANNLVVHNCIVFVDEIDAVGRHRGAGLGGGHDEREQTLNQLLVEMDGFESNEGVIMIAATNRPDVLDPALLRPGRFDRQIVVDWPDVRGREGILRVHTRKIPLSDDVDLKQIARGTPGLAGADLANIVNEAALLAARRNRKKVTQRDFEDAKDKVMLGMERRSLVMTEQERRSTAYHEAGHALVGWLLPGSDPVNKVTIIPRGRALGITSWVPQEERHNRSKEDLERMLGHMMGGRAAELLVFNHLTTGAISDIEQATETARNMVCRYGMSDALGPLTFGKKEEMVFLGKEIATHKDYSEQTAVLIDQEVRRIIESSYNVAMQVLRDNMDKLHLLANTLLEREVLDGDEMDRVLRGEKLPPMRPAIEPELASETAATAQEPPRDAAGQKLEPFPPPEPRPAGA